MASYNLSEMCKRYSIENTVNTQIENKMVDKLFLFVFLKID